MKRINNVRRKAGNSWRLAGLLCMSWAASSWAQGPAAPGSAKPPQAADVAFKPIILRARTNAPVAATVSEVRTTASRDLMREGMLDAQQGRTAQAIAKLEQVIKEAPQQVAAWETLGRTYWNAGQKEKTQQLLEQWRKLDPRNTAMLNLAGKIAVAENRLGPAQEFFSQSLQINPDQPDVRWNRARILRWDGNLEAAIQDLQAFKPTAGEQLGVNIELARALLSNRQFEEARPTWQQISMAQPTNVEAQISFARCLLHTGAVTNGLELVRQVLDAQPGNVEALLAMADYNEYGGHPEDARPWLRRILEVTQDSSRRKQIFDRLVALLEYLHNREPLKYPLDEAIEMARQHVKESPLNADARMNYAELLMEDGKLEPAEKEFLHVLRTFNLHNRRAHSGLFEVYTGLRRFGDAVRELTALTKLNPLDPYLHYRTARLEAARGRYHYAYKALDKLEQAGQRGAVACMLYHGLTTSEYLGITSVHDFREQLLAMKNAGFRIMTPDEIPTYFTQLNARQKELGVGRPELAICVTFDDARRDAMRLGTPIARELGVKLTEHVPVGAVERREPFICSWDMLRAYEKTGVWSFGSHLYEAHDRQPEDRHGENNVNPVTSRIWLTDQNRQETLEEYSVRLQQEYALSRKILETQLGHSVNFVAYPFGDLGQETSANVENALHENLRVAGETYQLGFIQSIFGYAVNGDNPLLYQRIAIKRPMTGDEAVNFIVERHPVFLARRLRAEFAALEGKVHLALQTLEGLRQDGYPSNSLTRVSTYVHDHLAGQFVADTKTEKVTKGPLQIELGKPYVGARGDVFRDNLDSRNWHLGGLGGLNLTPNLAVEGRAGVGQLRQPFTNSAAANIPDIQLDEKFIGIASSFTFPNGWVLMGELSDRMITGDVPTSMDGRTTKFDKSFIQYAIEGQAKPLLPLDVSVRWEHDLVPEARAVVKETTYDLGAINAVYSLFDWWDVWGSAQRYWFSDDNNRDHLGLTSSWLVYEPVGLHLGLAYAYATSATNNPDYWSPYKLNRYYLEAALRGTYMRAYYNLRLRYGVGRQSVRPEAEEAYKETVARLRREGSSQADIDAFMRDNEPSADWQPVFGASASTDVKLGEHWGASGEISYNKVPDYNEITVMGGVKYRF